MGKRTPDGWQFKARLDGVEKAWRALDTLKQGVRNKIKRKALTKGSQIVTRAAKANAPKESGLLRKSLSYRIRAYRRSGLVVAYIGPRLGFKAVYKGRNRDPIYYAHILERGRGAVVPQKARLLSEGKPGRVFGRKVKAVPGTRFLERSFRSTKAQVEAAMLAELKAGVEALGK